ncbi:glycosyltransferase family 4 protein [Calothrix sp. NIES-2098]|uniref:glycosyltransferase family 4 protein n=1 Tax=Calothrix sp. NIES-2098 TaxID=1954171 RepID=UPI000B6072BA|nr:putative glycosyl transferase, group 1 family protein [Calothrix sp. NIES-2098]
MTKIWVLTELYFPEQTSTGYLLTNTAEGLAEDYEVKVITGPASNFLQSVDYPCHEFRNNVELFRCRGTNFEKDWLLGRLINILTRSLAIFWKALSLCKDEDVILVVTNPPLLPFIAIFLKLLKGSRCVLLVHDVYPEVLSATGFVSSSSLLVKIGQVANSFLYRQADRIISLGRDMTKLIHAKLPEQEKEKVVCIPNWAENEIIYPTVRDKNKLIQELGVKERFVILYAGNMGKTHGIEYLAEAAKELTIISKDVCWIFLGFGAKKAWLEEYTKSQKLENITILSPRPRNEQVIFLNACDLAVIAFMPGMAGVSVPSRMYNQMAAGKPIVAVADDWSELAEVVREENIGWVIKPGDIEELVRTIQFAANNRDLCAEMGMRAAEVARNKYSFAQTNQAYKILFKEVLSVSSS